MPCLYVLIAKYPQSICHAYSDMDLTSRCALLCDWTSEPGRRSLAAGTVSIGCLYDSISASYTWRKTMSVGMAIRLLR